MTTKEQRREVMRSEVRARRSGQRAPSEPPGPWAARAACSGRSKIFDDPSREAEALAICAGCPVLSQCHGWSLHNAVEGVAGGMTSKTRKAWRKARKLAEPVVSIDDYRVCCRFG